MASPYPNLQIFPQSGLTFPWVEDQHAAGGLIGSGDIAVGNDGVALGMVMIIRWSDLAAAFQQLLGYSWRDTSTTPATLRRKLPWQSAYSNQLWVKNISGVKGIQLQGFQTAPILISGEGGVGSGVNSNFGPASIFTFAQLTLHFWRPPYYIRSDSDILDGSGKPQEWLRYVDKNWEINTQFLSREGSTFTFQGTSNPFQGSVGQKVTHCKVKRRWYQLPEAALFKALTDATPNGIPANFLYTQTQTTNPISGPDGGHYVYPIGQPITGCVNSPKGGGTNDSDTTKRFFGCYMGTLLYEGVEFIPQPLQLPPALMQIPSFANNEAISQVQYDVVLHFDLFDPPVAVSGGVPVHNFRGHNLMPYSGNAMWYPVISQQDANQGTVGPFLTPFMYADFNDLFWIL